MNTKDNSARCKHKKIINSKTYTHHKTQKVGISMSISSVMNFKLKLTISVKLFLTDDIAVAEYPNIFYTSKTEFQRYAHHKGFKFGCAYTQDYSR